MFVLSSGIPCPFPGSFLPFAPRCTFLTALEPPFGIEALRGVEILRIILLEPSTLPPVPEPFIGRSTLLARSTEVAEAVLVIVPDLALDPFAGR